MARIATCALVILSSVVPALAFDSGSDGSFGPIEVLSGTTTVPLPPDGVIHATTVTVQFGGTLRFEPNALNTPVFLLATGDVNVGGAVDVAARPGPAGGAGLGGPGGYDGGRPGNPPGDGGGPGGGRGGVRGSGPDDFGSGAFGCPNTTQVRSRDGQPYGNDLLLDLMGGSGGGGSDIGGGGGGGAILIASSTRISVGGSISADGGAVDFFTGGGGGSGGGIRLVAPVVAGNGLLLARGANTGSPAASGNGRIRIDALDRTQMGMLVVPACSFTSGSVMIARPLGLGALRLVEVAGTAVSADATAEVVVPVAAGAPAEQDVVVEVRDHHAPQDIEIVLQGSGGIRTSFPATVPSNGGAPVQLTVPVTLPAGSPIHVFAWTR